MKTTQHNEHVQEYPLLGEFMDNPTQENAEALRDYYGKVLERGQEILKAYQAARKG